MAAGLRIAAMLKYLRIAVTALSLTACMLLIALWVRSYGRSIDVDLPVSSRVGVGLLIKDGTIAAQFVDSQQTRLMNLLLKELFDEMLNEVDSDRTYVVTTSCDFTAMDSPPPPFAPRQPARKPGISDFRWQAGYVRAPFWFITLAVAAVACVPWISWSKRFGLRTLLIATALIAVAFGAFAISR